MPYTRDDNWIPELNNMRDNYFPVRTSIVINQLKNANLFYDLNTPIVNVNGESVNTNNLKFNDSLSVAFVNPGFSGDVYYTTNGTDPREIGGLVSKDAILFDGKPLTISSTTSINVRVNFYDEWSAPAQVNLLKTDEDYSMLKVTELNYHPLDSIIGADTINGKKYEFIEFKNTGDNLINLSGLVLDSAVYYEFPENEILNAGQFYVISSKTDRFYERYGMESSGNYKGYFSNSGEEVLLHDHNGTPIIHFIYDDKDPWPELADGEGYSLVSVSRSPTGDPNEPVYWKNSIKIGGSPFADEHILESVNSIFEEGKDVVIYPNPTNDLITINVTNDNIDNNMVVEIYSITGILMYRAKHSLKTTLSLGQLNLLSGFYIVKIWGKDFSKSFKVYLLK